MGWNVTFTHGWTMMLIMAAAHERIYMNNKYQYMLSQLGWKWYSLMGEFRKNDTGDWYDASYKPLMGEDWKELYQWVLVKGKK